MSESESKPESKPVKKQLIFQMLLELCKSGEQISLEEFCTRLGRQKVDVLPENLRQFFYRELPPECLHIKSNKVCITATLDELTAVLLNGKFGELTRAVRTKVAATGRAEHLPREPRD